MTWQVDRGSAAGTIDLGLCFLELGNVNIAQHRELSQH
jgi:hypothetical protein